MLIIKRSENVCLNVFFIYWKVLCWKLNLRLTERVNFLFFLQWDVKPKWGILFAITSLSPSCNVFESCLSNTVCERYLTLWSSLRQECPFKSSAEEWRGLFGLGLYSRFRTCSNLAWLQLTSLKDIEVTNLILKRIVSLLFKTLL